MDLSRFAALFVCMLCFAACVHLGNCIDVVEASGQNVTIMNDSPNTTVIETVEASTPAKGIRKVYKCKFTPGKRLENRDDEVRCCGIVKRKYHKWWYFGGRYLTTYLDNLKAWECPELETECEKRYFDFTPFTHMVYMRVCDPEKYQSSCRADIENARSSASTRTKRSNPAYGVDDATSDDSWMHLVAPLRSYEMTDEEVMKPCVQVALYEAARGGTGRYHETIQVMIPFCGFIWCGYDADTIHQREISVWTCMPKSCRVGVGISAAVIACLGVATFVANITVIAVYCMKRRLNNCQSVYKVTLAIGDTYVGAVVFPTFISTFYFLYMSREAMGDVVGVAPDPDSNGTMSLRKPKASFKNGFTQPYLDGVGFFTTLSLILSVYTLMLASFDRMSAVARPMAYNRRKSLQISKWACLILMVVALVAASTPLFTNTLTYGLVASILVSLYGESALIMYIIAFLVPLVLVWATTIALFVYSKKYTRVRRRLSSTSSTNLPSFESRLAKTLGIMVGAFTASILPSAVTMIVSFFLSDIYYDAPERLSMTSAKIYVSFEFVCVVILATNSLWNCFIYSSRHEEFRKAAKELYSSASQRVGATAIWRTVRRMSERHLTASTSNTSISTKPSFDKSRDKYSCESAKPGERSQFSTSKITQPSTNYWRMRESCDLSVGSNDIAARSFHPLACSSRVEESQADSGAPSEDAKGPD